MGRAKNSMGKSRLTVYFPGGRVTGARQSHVMSATRGSDEFLNGTPVMQLNRRVQRLVVSMDTKELFLYEESYLKPGTWTGTMASMRLSSAPGTGWRWERCLGGAGTGIAGKAGQGQRVPGKVSTLITTSGLKGGGFSPIQISCKPVLVRAYQSVTRRPYSRPCGVGGFSSRRSWVFKPYCEHIKPIRGGMCPPTYTNLALTVPITWTYDPWRSRAQLASGGRGWILLVRQETVYHISTRVGPTSHGRTKPQA